MSSYQIEKNNKYFQMVASILKHEIDPKTKASFFSEVNLIEIESIRARVSSIGIKKPSYTAFVVKAIALALKKYPYANRRVCRTLWPLAIGLRLQRFDEIDVTVAIERRVPNAEMLAFVDIVRNADQLSILEINDKLRALVESDVSTNKQWREYSALIKRFPIWLSSLVVRLPLYFPSLWVKYRGGASMVSSPGKYGVDIITTNWWSPIGISFGKVKNRVIAQNNKIESCPTFIVTVNFDLRTMAGAQAAQFGNHFINLLENAETEMARYMPVEWQLKGEETTI